MTWSVAENSGRPSSCSPMLLFIRFKIMGVDLKCTISFLKCKKKLSGYYVEQTTMQEELPTHGVWLQLAFLIRKKRLYLSSPSTCQHTTTFWITVHSSYEHSCYLLLLHLGLLSGHYMLCTTGRRFYSTTLPLVGLKTRHMSVLVVQWTVHTSYLNSFAYVFWLILF